jgi:hypothetical protein
MPIICFREISGLYGRLHAECPDRGVQSFSGEGQNIASEQATTISFHITAE